MNNKIIFAVVVVASVGGCKIYPASSYDETSGYTYIPLDPLRVITAKGENCTAEEKVLGGSSEPSASPQFKDVLSSLPDNTVRMVVENFTSGGSVTYGVGKIGGNSEHYRVTADYISADTINFRLWINKQVRYRNAKIAVFGGSELENSNWQQVSILDPLTSEYSYGNATANRQSVVAERYNVLTDSDYKDRSNKVSGGAGLIFTPYNIPVYVGIGIRITSNVEITGSKANLSGIGVIGAEAQANNLKGSLIVQTLGVSGKAVSSALPMHSELNATTAQNALIAAASIKTLIYSDDTEVYPRIVGLYLPLPSSRPLVNSIISAISSSNIEWSRPCGIKKPKSG